MSNLRKNDDGTWSFETNAKFNIGAIVSTNRGAGHNYLEFRIVGMTVLEEKWRGISYTAVEVAA